MLGGMVSIAPFERPGVRGYLHRPDRASGQGLVLTHGAGGNCNTALLTKVADAFSAEGVHVLRCDLPFRQRRPSGPPSPATAAADRDGLRSALDGLRGIVPGRVFLGGHSYGGRQATLLAAEEPGVAASLLLLSYPLHPPRKPAQPRTEHFLRLRVPAVFVHGTGDAFGSLAELQSAVSAIPAWTQIIPIAGAGHDLRKGLFDLGPVMTALLANGF